MTIILSIFVGAVGAYLLMWTVNLRRMATARRPRFYGQAWFRLGIPALGLMALGAGFTWALSKSWVAGVGALLLVTGLGVLVILHDQYSATMRILFDDYRHLKQENPKAPEFDLLYSIVRSRKPLWTEDRVIEMCVGKDVKQLVLLLLVVEYQIHPLDDMDLYQRLKQEVERLGQKA
ncbi:MAG: hypothetical protein U0V70_20145 [Terriglobia bacterium]